VLLPMGDFTEEAVWNSDVFSLRRLRQRSHHRERSQHMLADVYARLCV